MFAGSLTGKRVDLHRRALRDARQARQTVGACSHPNTNSEYTTPPVDNCRDGEQGAGEREEGAPSMFIAQEPQMPSRQDLRKVSVVSSSFLILINASSTCGRHIALSVRGSRRAY